MELKELFRKILSANTSNSEFSWLEKAVEAGREKEGLLQLAFVAVPRYIDKKVVSIDPELQQAFTGQAGFSPEGWSLQRLARTYILIHFRPEDEKKYVSKVTALFDAAEINELITLHASLSLLHYPAAWLERAREGVRSNMGSVFDSIAFNNPYPSKHFDESAWNQLVLKTIFSGKGLEKIYGLKERSNKTLAYMVSDFAHERWSAGRPISPQVWELVTPYVDDRLVDDLETLFRSGDPEDKNAAARSCSETSYVPAKDLLKKYHVPVNAQFTWTGNYKNL